MNRRMVTAARTSQRRSDFRRRGRHDSVITHRPRCQLMRVLYGGIRRHIGRTYRGNFRRGSQGSAGCHAWNNDVSILASSNSIRAAQGGAGVQWQTYLTQTRRLVRFAQGGTRRVRTWWTGGDGITFGNFILIVPKSFRASNRLANSGNRPPSEPADPCRVGKGRVGEIGHSTAWASRRKTGGYS